MTPTHFNKFWKAGTGTNCLAAERISPHFRVELADEMKNERMAYRSSPGIEKQEKYL